MKTIFSLVFSLSLLVSYAQGEANIWYFGWHAGSNNNAGDPKKDYKTYFKSLSTRFSISPLLTAVDTATNLAAYALTRQFRHLFGPDAIAISGNFAAVAVAGFKLEEGIVFVFRGDDAGKGFSYTDSGFGLFVPAVSGSFSVTKLYYSRDSDFYNDVFFGNRAELNVSFGEILSGGFSGLYAPLDNGNAVYDIGVSIGIGASVLPVDVNLNGGSTNLKKL